MTGIDPIKLRRRNLIKSSAMPYKTAVGTTIDSGEFETVLDKALALADHDGFKQRRREAAKRGKYRGFGISCMLEHAGGFPLEGDRAELSRRRAPRARPQRAVDRPGPRHRVQSHAGGTAGHQAGADRAPARRLRDGDRGLRVGRLALRDDGEPCADQDRRGAADQGQDDRRHRAGNGGNRHRISRRAFRRGRDRSQHHPVRSRRPRQGDEEARRNPRRPRHQDQCGNAADISQRLPHRRGRDRSEDRRDGARGLCRGRRLRPPAQHHDRRGPDPRLHRPGPGPGDDGERGVRQLRRAAGHRLVHGLRDAARRRHALVQGRDPLRCRRRPIRSA